jgi:hypothetical protein
MGIDMDAVRAAIGVADMESLREIEGLIKGRRSALATEAFYSLKPGDRVRIAENVSPKVLAGQPGVIVSKGRSKVAITLDNAPTPKWSGRINCPPEMLDLEV